MSNEMFDKSKKKILQKLIKLVAPSSKANWFIIHNFFFHRRLDKRKMCDNERTNFSSNNVSAIFILYQYMYYFTCESRWEIGVEENLRLYIHASQRM